MVVRAGALPSKTSWGARMLSLPEKRVSKNPLRKVLLTFLSFSNPKVKYSPDGSTFPKEYFDGEKSEIGGPGGVRNRVS